MAKLAGDMTQALHTLEGYARMGEEEFLSNPERVGNAKYTLIVAMEAAIDLCRHIVARLGMRTPSDYADCFAVLGEAGVVSEELADRLAQMARFRNLLVHLYGRVDDRRVFRIIQDDIRDLKDYIGCIFRYMGRTA
ncbi:MAG TPA: DUF86 domain-containing protein [Candidatus Latescibacteria bacterium]|nr:DUF86 domain-containing protein [Candidatus Latescibacterota bacterium]